MTTLQLRDYQLAAADFLVANPRAMVLAQVGAGKTALTIKAMERVGGRWLVLAPKRVATDVWPAELEKWCSYPLRPAPYYHSQPMPGQSFEAADARARLQVYVVNYERIHQLPSLGLFTGIVFDELTRLKDPSGKRFKMLEKLLKESNVKYRWGLTGSFTSNGLEDVFGQCKIVNQSLLGRAKGAFLQQYFYCINRDWGQWTPAPGALAQVMERIKPATFVLEAAEYHDKLPPLHVVEVPCALADRKPYEDMRKHYVADLAGQQITAMTAAAASTKLQQLASGFAYGPEYVDAPFGLEVPKPERSAQWFSAHKFDRLDELLAENQRANTIVFYSFVEELRELQRRYPKAVAITEHGAIDRWNAGQVEILLAHPKSAGHGLNLQHGGSTIVFLSPLWSLELYEQAIGRLHRSGQKHPVWVYVLMGAKTIDERIMAGLKDRRSISDIALEELKGE